MRIITHLRSSAVSYILLAYQLAWKPLDRQEMIPERHKIMTCVHMAYLTVNTRWAKTRTIF